MELDESDGNIVLRNRKSSPVVKWSSIPYSKIVKLLFLQDNGDKTMAGTDSHLQLSIKAAREAQEAFLSVLHNQKFSFVFIMELLQKRIMELKEYPIIVLEEDNEAANWAVRKQDEDLLTLAEICCYLTIDCQGLEDKIKKVQEKLSLTEDEKKASFFIYAENLRMSRICDRLTSNLVLQLFDTVKRDVILSKHIDQNLDIPLDKLNKTEGLKEVLFFYMVRVFEEHDKLNRIYTDKLEDLLEKVGKETEDEDDQRTIKSVISSLSQYPMECRPAGYCVVFCVTNGREGAQGEINKVKNVFEKSLGYIVHVEENPTLKKLEERKKVLEKPKYRFYDSIVLWFMAHGSDTDLQLADGTSYQRENFIDSFSRLDNFRKKPKVFFMASCRGRSTIPITKRGGVRVTVDSGEEGETFSVIPETYRNITAVYYKMDRLVANATLPEQYAFRLQDGVMQRPNIPYSKIVKLLFLQDNGDKTMAGTDSYLQLGIKAARDAKDAFLSVLQDQKFSFVFIIELLQKRIMELKKYPIIVLEEGTEAANWAVRKQDEDLLTLAEICHYLTTDCQGLEDDIPLKEDPEDLLTLAEICRYLTIDCQGLEDKIKQVQEKLSLTEDEKKASFFIYAENLRMSRICDRLTSALVQKLFKAVKKDKILREHIDQNLDIPLDKLNRTEGLKEVLFFYMVRVFEEHDKLNRIYTDKLEDLLEKVGIETEDEDDQRTIKSVISSLSEYPMECRPAGYCVVFCVTNGRKGAQGEINKVKKVFEKSLGYIVHVEENPTLKKLEERIEVLEKPKYRFYDSIVFWFMAHGSETNLKLADGKSYQREEIIDSFSRLDNFRKKPKIFFMASCRGCGTIKVEERGGLQVTVDASEEGETFSVIPEKYRNITAVYYKMDRLVANATLPEQYAFRLQDGVMQRPNIPYSKIVKLLFLQDNGDKTMAGTDSAEGDYLQLSIEAARDAKDAFLSVLQDQKFSFVFIMELLQKRIEELENYQIIEFEEDNEAANWSVRKQDEDLLTLAEICHYLTTDYQDLEDDIPLKEDPEDLPTLAEICRYFNIDYQGLEDKIKEVQEKLSLTEDEKKASFFIYAENLRMSRICDRLTSALVLQLFDTVKRDITLSKHIDQNLDIPLDKLNRTEGLKEVLFFYMVRVFEEHDKLNRIYTDKLEDLLEKVGKETEDEDDQRTIKSVISSLSEYPMECRPAGYCVVFCVTNGREGAQGEINNVKNVFEKFLGYIVHVEENPTLKKLEERKKVLEKPKYRFYDSIVFWFMAHGSETDLKLADGKSYQREEFIDKFSRLDNFRKKPKVFFMASCRGSGTIKVEERGGLQVTVDAMLPSMTVSVIPEKYRNITAVYYKMDRLVANATLPEQYAFRLQDGGSVYVDTVCRLLEKYRGDNITKVLERVSNKMHQILFSCNKEFKGEAKQACFYETTFQKTFIVPGAKR
nr:uncharacterized protein LOC123758837 isoform X2 [Procambarus clarkii]